MPGRIDQVENIGLAIFSRVVETNGLRLDGDPALPLQIHLVQELILLFPIGQGPGKFEKAVGQGRFAVIDVGDDGKISYVLYDHRSLFCMRA